MVEYLKTMKLKLGSVGLKLMLKKYLNNMRLCLKWIYPCLCYVFVLALSQNHCWPSFYFSKNHRPFHRWQWWVAKPFIQWQWSSCTKTIEKPSTTMVLWQKPLTIPSCSKFDHRCGLSPTKRQWQYKIERQWQWLRRDHLENTLKKWAEILSTFELFDHSV